MDPHPPPQRAATDDDLLPIVNEHDEPVGVLPRRQVHLERRLHRAVHVCVFDAAGRIVLQQRASAKDTFPGFWDWACTGHVDPDESYDAAARRELREELGIDLAAGNTPLHYLFKQDACDLSGWEFQAFYAMRWRDPIPFNREEIGILWALQPRQLASALEQPWPNLPLTPAVALGWPRLHAAMMRG